MNVDSVTGGEMRVAACLLLGLALSGGVLAQSSGATAASRARMERDEWFRRESLISDVVRRAREIAPRRRDEPLRELNISDDEVREIQSLVRDLLPRAIVNIGPVVTGCPCEEGRGCTEQVYLQANTATDSVGLLLSRVAKRWDVSRIQKWWLKWQAFQSRAHKLSYLESREQEWELARVFPACTPDDGSPEKIPAQPRAEPRK